MPLRLLGYRAYGNKEFGHTNINRCRGMRRAERKPGGKRIARLARDASWRKVDVASRALRAIRTETRATQRRPASQKLKALWLVEVARLEVFERLQASRLERYEELP